MSTKERRDILAFGDKLFPSLAIVGALGFWEAWRLPLVCRELRFSHSGGESVADVIALGLERRGVWAALREARAARRGSNGETQLISACRGELEDVQRACELLELGRPGCVNAYDFNGDSALTLASVRGHAGVVASLLAAGAHVDTADNGASTALLGACLYGHDAVASLLVARGANVRARNRVGWTPLACAKSSCGPAVAALLFAAGAEICAAYDAVVDEEVEETE